MNTPRLDYSSPSEAFLTTKDVAYFCQVHPRTVDAWRKSGKLEAWGQIDATNPKSPFIFERREVQRFERARQAGTTQEALRRDIVMFNENAFSNVWICYLHHVEEENGGVVLHVWWNASENGLRPADDDSGLQEYRVYADPVIREHLKKVGEDGSWMTSLEECSVWLRVRTYERRIPELADCMYHAVDLAIPARDVVLSRRKEIILTDDEPGDPE